jgi:uncharacterized protein YjaZ
LIEEKKYLQEQTKKLEAKFLFEQQQYERQTEIIESLKENVENERKGTIEEESLTTLSFIDDEDRQNCKQIIEKDKVIQQLEKQLRNMLK